MVTRSELFEMAERLKRSSRLGPLLDLCDAILSLECDGSDWGLSGELSSLRQALSARDNEIGLS